MEVEAIFLVFVNRLNARIQGFLLVCLHLKVIACHTFDLDAAKAVGFKTAFVRRPKEWGIESPPDPTPNPHHDIIVDDFTDLASALGVS